MRIGEIVHASTDPAYAGTSWGTAAVSFYPVEAKWPVGAGLTGCEIWTGEALVWDNNSQVAWDFAENKVASLFMYGAEYGDYSVAQGVAANAGVTGTGGWITIARLDTVQTLATDCNIAVDGVVAYSETSVPGFIQ
jgi:hypothetical protein